MNLPIDKDELHVIITQLWKSRKSEAKVDALHKKLKDFSSGKIDFQFQKKSEKKFRPFFTKYLFMIFWIGFTLMFLNEGFVMMRHISPFFARLRDKVMKKLGDKLWWRLHGTLDWLWISLVTCGLIVNSHRVLHIMVLATFWTLAWLIFYLPRWITKKQNYD